MAKDYFEELGNAPIPQAGQGLPPAPEEHSSLARNALLVGAAVGSLLAANALLQKSDHDRQIDESKQAIEASHHLLNNAIVLKSGARYRVSPQIENGGPDDSNSAGPNNIAGTVPEGKELEVYNPIIKEGDDGWFGFIAPTKSTDAITSVSDLAKITVWAKVDDLQAQGYAYVPKLPKKEPYALTDWTLDDTIEEIVDFQDVAPQEIPVAYSEIHTAGYYKKLSRHHGKTGEKPPVPEETPGGGSTGMQGPVPEEAAGTADPYNSGAGEENAPSDTGNMPSGGGMSHNTPHEAQSGTNAGNHANQGTEGHPTINPPKPEDPTRSAPDPQYPTHS